jgi:glycerate 2-kinase
VSGAPVDARALLAELFAAALAAVDARQAVERALLRDGAGALHVGGSSALDAAACDVLALGKAALAMARAWHERVGAPRAGLAIAREPGELPAPWRVRVGGHPLPTRASERAGRAALAFAARVAPERTLVVLLSGGASALATAPLPGLSLAELRSTTSALLRSGADIGELNTVRKHLTAASGGRIAQACRARAVEVLAISDVAADDLATLGSGPFAPDPTTFGDAIAVLRRRGVWDAVPPGVRAHLARGASGALADTPKPGDPSFARVVHHVIASNAAAQRAAERAACARGIAVVREPEALRGEAREVGAALAARALALRGSAPRLLIAGGETTVTVRGDGRGGRCQELALAAALALQGEPGVELLASGTDGSDGPTEAAGAFADGGTVARGRAAGGAAAGALARNDAHGFFAREGGLWTTGPTGTNALDVVLVWVAPRS